MTKSVLLTTVFLLVPVLGCSDDGCPSGHVRVDGNCEVYGPGGPPGSKAGTGNTDSTDDDSDDDSASGGTSASGGSPSTAGNEASGGTPTASNNEVAFDATCKTHADCGGPTNYCATPPTEPAYCSVSGCNADPTVCPAGWACMDLGAFVPGEPHICAKLPPVGNGAFGDACNTHTDCKGETNYCAVSPTEPPYCSVSGCDADASLCPEGWLCFDVGQFVPGEPFICVKPPPAQ